MDDHKRATHLQAYPAAALQHDIPVDLYPQRATHLPRRVPFTTGLCFPSTGLTWFPVVLCSCFPSTVTLRSFLTYRPSSLLTLTVRSFVTCSVWSLRTVMHRSFATVILWSWPLLFWSRPEPSALHHRYLLVVTNGLRVVSLHIRRPIIQHLRIHVLLRVDIDLFTARGVFKPQFIKAASFIGLRPYRHLRLRPRQAPRRTVVLMVRPPHDYRLVRVPVQEVNNHLGPRAVSPLPNPGPAHACDTLTQHELASVAGLYLSQ